MLEQPRLLHEVRTDLKGASFKLFRFPDSLGLNACLREILSDRDLPAFLAANVPEDSGLVLGSTAFFDDAKVDVVYGLTLGARPTRAALLYTQESVAGWLLENPQLGLSFPDYSRYGSDFRGWPSASDFVARINEALARPNDFCVGLPHLS